MGGIHMYVPQPWCRRCIREGVGGWGRSEEGGMEWGGGGPYVCPSALVKKVHKRGGGWVGGWGRSEEGGMEWGGGSLCMSLSLGVEGA